MKNESKKHVGESASAFDLTEATDAERLQIAELTNENRRLTMQLQRLSESPVQRKIRELTEDNERLRNLIKAENPSSGPIPTHGNERLRNLIKAETALPAPIPAVSLNEDKRFGTIKAETASPAPIPAVSLPSISDLTNQQPNDMSNADQSTLGNEAMASVPSIPQFDFRTVRDLQDQCQSALIQKLEDSNDPNFMRIKTLVEDAEYESALQLLDAMIAHCEGNSSGPALNEVSISESVSSCTIERLLLAKARVLLKMERLDSARRAAQLCILKKPNFMPAYGLLCRIEYEREEYDQAELALRLGLFMDSKELLGAISLKLIRLSFEKFW